VLNIKQDAMAVWLFGHLRKERTGISISIFSDLAVSGTLRVSCHGRVLHMTVFSRDKLFRCLAPEAAALVERHRVIIGLVICIRAEI
jgi:hypothetical protein